MPQHSLPYVIWLLMLVVCFIESFQPTTFICVKKKNHFMSMMENRLNWKCHFCIYAFIRLLKMAFIKKLYNEMRLNACAKFHYQVVIW